MTFRYTASGDGASGWSPGAQTLELERLVITVDSKLSVHSSFMF